MYRNITVTVTMCRDQNCRLANTAPMVTVFRHLLSFILWFYYWEVLVLDRKRKRMQLLRNVLQQSKVSFTCYKPEVIEISMCSAIFLLAFNYVCKNEFFQIFFGVSIWLGMQSSHYKRIIAMSRSSRCYSSTAKKVGNSFRLCL